MGKLQHVVLVSTVLISVAATAAPKIPDMPVGAEVSFVQLVQTTLRSEYPTPASAEKAGYFRYTDVDNTGAISYVNPAYWSSDVKHPSQLWYGVHGELLGVDYTQPYSKTPPSMWGVNPARWSKYGAHIHWNVERADGTLKYGNYAMPDKYKAAGGDPMKPSASVLVAMKKVTDPTKVVNLFAFPDLWDLELWVKENPKGAFADANPLVPVPKNASGMGT